MSNTVKTKKPKKLHKPMSMKFKVSITVAVLVIAVIVAVLSFGSGAMTFKPGAVQSHDDPVDVTESPVIGEDGAAIPQENRHTVLVSVGNGGSASPAGSVRESYHFRAEIPKAARVGISVKATLVHRACWSLRGTGSSCNLSGTAGIVLSRLVSRN